MQRRLEVSLKDDLAGPAVCRVMDRPTLDAADGGGG
jgi:hypothetical protein